MKPREETFPGKPQRLKKEAANDVKAGVSTFKVGRKEEPTRRD